MNKRTKTRRILNDQKLLDGLQKKLGKSGSLVFGETKHTCAQLVAMLRERLDSLQAVEAAHAAWKRALLEDATLLETTDPVVSGARQALLSLFGENVEALAAFGLAPRKKQRALGSDALAKKVAKLRATRKKVEPAPSPAPAAGNGIQH